ncbi:MAG: hypothetical protein PHP02_02920 [Eubacteriales bacterium]|nr:hypothetical protein [Eubacteriales bacterium]
MKPSERHINHFGPPDVPEGDWYPLSPRRRREILNSRLRLEKIRAELLGHW